MDNILEQNELNRSMQEVGVRILADELEKKDLLTDIQYVGAEYAVIVSEINSRKSLIITKTVMYPANYENVIEGFSKQADTIIADLTTDKELEKLDVYVMGVGAVQKYVDTDEERGVFRIGGKYAAAFGVLRLIRKAMADNLGYTLDNPLPVDSVECEYAMLKNVMMENGVVVKKNRIGSMRSSNGNIVDKWFLDVADLDGVFTYRYFIFMDPYAETEESCLKKLFPSAPFGEWNMPAGFTSLWFDEGFSDPEDEN